MSKYTIRTPLKREGKRLDAGETIELGKKDAAPLLAVGAIAEYSAKKSADDPAPGATPPTGEGTQGGDDPAAGMAAAGESSGKVNVNTASAAAIALAAKGIGKKTAADIVAHRDEKGAFGSLDELTAVGGISQAIVDDNRAVLTL